MGQAAWWAAELLLAATPLACMCLTKMSTQSVCAGSVTLTAAGKEGFDLFVHATREKRPTYSNALILLCMCGYLC
jgi:hypothetical protein